MKVAQKHEYKDGKFIFTREVSDFSDYELEVLKKLYDNKGLSTYDDEYSSKYISTISNLEKVGLLYKSLNDYYDSPTSEVYSAKYQLSDCVKDILEDK